MPEDLLDSPRWWEVGVCFSSPVFQGGFEHSKGFELGAVDGVDGQYLQGTGSRGVSLEAERRVPLGVAEQRGFGYPRGVLRGGSRGALNDSVGR